MNKKILFTLSLLSILVFLSGCGGGGGGGDISAPPGTNPGVPSVIKLLDVQNIAQTNSTIFLKAKVLDGNGTPVKNVAVTFTDISTVLFGHLSATIVNTDSYGIATVTLNSAVPGFATILAEVYSAAGQIRDKRTVYFTANIKLEASMTLDVNSVPGNGIYNETSDFILFESTTDDTAEVLATVFDAGGVPVAAGMSVSWSKDQPEAIFVRTETSTNVNGQAKAVVQVLPGSLRATETSVNIGAFAGNGAANMVTLFLQPVVVSSAASSLSAVPTTVAPGGNSALTAIVILNTGARAPDGTSVSFTTTCGSVTPFGLTLGTDPGVAVGTFTAPLTEGTCTVSAVAGGVTIGSVDILVTQGMAVFPTTATVDGGLGGSPLFTITGGTAPYSLLSSDTFKVTVPPTVAASGGTFNATVPAGTTAGSVTVQIRDAAGATTTVTITITVVAPPALSVVLAAATVTGVDNPPVGNANGGCAGTDGNPSDDYTGLISGGTPPYSVLSSSNLSVVPLCAITLTGVNNENITIDPDSVGANTAVSIVIRDSSSPVKNATITLTVAP